MSAALDALYLGFETRSDPTGGEVETYDGPLHAVLFGPNGVGKGMRVLAPNLLQIRDKSIVVIDPKAQLAAMTARWRFENGNDVKIIDPFGVLAEVTRAQPKIYRELIELGLIESVGFNPLVSLDPKSEMFYDDAAVISEAMIKVQGNDPHWAESAQGLCTALIMWERFHYGDKANLGNVRHMLTEADYFTPSKTEGGRDVLRGGLRHTAMQMLDSGNFAIESLAGRFAGSFTDETESVRSTADTQTRWLLSEPMRADLEKDGVDFSTLKTSERPTTVYVILPAHLLETHSVWLRLVVSVALRANMTAGGRRGVLMILDEFAALGRLAIIEQLFGVTRDYKVQIWPVFQDLPQLKGLYSERWETLLGMAGVVQSFCVGDLTSAEWISKRAGNKKVWVPTVGLSNNSGNGGPTAGSSEGMSQEQEPIIPYENMFHLEYEKTIVFRKLQQGHEVLVMPHIKDIDSLYARGDKNPYF